VTKKKKKIAPEVRLRAALNTLRRGEGNAPALADQIRQICARLERTLESCDTSDEELIRLVFGGRLAEAGSILDQILGEPGRLLEELVARFHRVIERAGVGLDHFGYTKESFAAAVRNQHRENAKAQLIAFLADTRDEFDYPAYDVGYMYKELELAQATMADLDPSEPEIATIKRERDLRDARERVTDWRRGDSIIPGVELTILRMGLDRFTPDEMELTPEEAARILSQSSEDYMAQGATELDDPETMFKMAKRMFQSRPDQK
jgi:hypothetical protein